MTATIRTIALMIICFFALQTANAATGQIKVTVNHKAAKTDKKSTESNPEMKSDEAHWVKGATMDNFVMPVNPMQRPVKAPLV